VIYKYCRGFDQFFETNKQHFPYKTHSSYIKRENFEIITKSSFFPTKLRLNINNDEIGIVLEQIILLKKNLFYFLLFLERR
jgi:hypothetical protein